ncbi:esterase-like activity of phytase family protein [Microbaculum marinum]|uniref:Esterase-like activity of phytase family protein n=1 Tax=Microbaculum marinum TaxID=1764581 RepID=A0AAW9RQF3_9HYPH
MRTQIVLAAGLVLCLSAGTGSAQETLPVSAAPIAAFDPQQPEQTRFGRLRYIGGIEIDSPDPRFGGLSGIDISPDGRRIMMVSDIGDLFTAAIDYDGDRPVGLSDVVVRRLPGEDGQPLGVKFGSDAESLRARTGKGLPDDILVGFERDNRVLAFPVAGDGAIGKPTRMSLPDGVISLPHNKGLEGIAVVPPGAPNAGAVIVFAESVPDETSDEIPGWIVTGAGARDIALRRSSGFDVTDILALSSGDLLVLERRFNILTGVAMRIRRLDATELDGPQPMAGDVLFTGGMAYWIDNMEGICVHEDPAGRTIVTIVSDDNFSALQRTLLLQFELL